MVNIAPPTVKDKDLVDECTKIRNSGQLYMQFTQWQVQKLQTYHSLNIYQIGKVR
jgi:hypothetical protein